MYLVAPATLFHRTFAPVPVWVPLTPVGAAGGLLAGLVVVLGGVVFFVVVVVEVEPPTVTVVLADLEVDPLVAVTVTLCLPDVSPVRVAEVLEALTTFALVPTTTRTL